MSVCLSVVCLPNAGTLLQRLNISNVLTVEQPHYSSFFPYQMVWQYSDGDTPNEGIERTGYAKSLFSPNISLYLGNNTRSSHSYYGMWIGNCTKLLNGTDFQWPSMTCSPNFKVMILFKGFCLHRESKKTCSSILKYNFGKCRPILKTLSPLDSAIHWHTCYTADHTQACH